MRALALWLPRRIALRIRPPARLAREAVLCPPIPQPDRQEAAPHLERPGGVRGRGGEGGAAEGAGEGGRGEGPPCPGGEGERGREQRREREREPVLVVVSSSCCCCCSSERHQGQHGQQVDAAPGGREHPGDEGDARGRREGAGGGGGCRVGWVREKKKEEEEEVRKRASERHGRLVACRPRANSFAIRGLFSRVLILYCCSQSNKSPCSHRHRNSKRMRVEDRKGRRKTWHQTIRFSSFLTSSGYRFGGTSRQLDRLPPPPPRLPDQSSNRQGRQLGEQER